MFCRRVLLVLLAALGACHCAQAQVAVPTTPYTWKQVPVTPGGFVTGLVVSPAKPSLKAIRTDVGGAYRWNAGQGKWEAITDGLLRDGWGTESIAVDARDPDAVAIAASGPNSTSDISRSRDRGGTWTRLNLRKPDGAAIYMGPNDPWRHAGERLAIDPNNSNVIYFSSRKDGLWRTLDGGQTWATVPAVPPGVAGAGQTFVVFDPESQTARGSATICVGVTGAGVFRSRDGGATWAQLIGPGANFWPMRALVDTSGTLWVTYQVGDKWDGPQGGAIWRFDGEGGRDVSPKAEGFCALSVDPLQPNRVVAASWPFSTLYRSLDGGASWKPITTKFEQPSYYPGWYARNWIADVVIDPQNPAHTWFANGTGVYRTRNNTGDEQTFALDGSGIEELCTLSLRKVPGGPLLWSVNDLVGFALDRLDAPPLHSFEDGQQGHTTSLDFSQANPRTVVRVGGTYGRESFNRISSDGGHSWRALGALPDDKKWGSIAISCADSQSLVWLPADWTTPYFSTDGGASWKPSAGPDGTPKTAPMQLWHNSPYSTSAPLVADPQKRGTFYLYGKDASFWRSENGGASWARVCPSQRAQLPDWWQYVLKAAPDAPGELWMNFVGAGKGNGLYRSLDGGANWTKLEAPGQCRAFGFGRAAPGHKRPALFVAADMAGSGWGIYRSDDALEHPANGAKWVRVDDPRQPQLLPELTGLEGDPDAFGRVFLAASGRGLFVGVPSSR